MKIKQVQSIIDQNAPLISNLANLSRVLMDLVEGTFWCGFYLADEENNLYLGPYQGSLACTHIKYGHGVCGKSLELKKSLIVPDVHKFPGHIACSSLSNSEIVVPIIKDNKVIGIIDLDSTMFDNYTEEDKEFLEEVANIIANL
ncbi:MAG: GAF domain-containing protein [Bacilli bacterium]|nr:GAF domain-containing protein [Bacilli bacterium]